MFSKLIQESFPEDLKVKLLQGASLEEPLFGPKGKIPKIIREPIFIIWIKLKRFWAQFYRVITISFTIKL